MIRLVYALRRSPALTREAFQAHWRLRHGPLVAGLAGALGLLRYVQTHTTAGAVMEAVAEAAGILCYRQVHRADHPRDAALRLARGTETPPYLGHAEVWIDQGRSPDSPESRAAGRALVEDERRFIDFERSTMLFGKKHTFVDHR